MKIDVTEHEQIKILRLSGRIDALSAGEFQRAVDAQLEKGATRLAFDFRDVPYISSAGLRVLLGTAKRVHQKGRVSVFGLAAGVKQVFEMAGFEKIVAVCEEETAALQEAAGLPPRGPDGT